jgi:hypothetical protein
MKKVMIASAVVALTVAALAQAQSSAWKIVGDERFSVATVENKTDIEKSPRQASGY